MSTRCPAAMSCDAAHSAAGIRPSLSGGTFPPPKSATSVKVWILPPALRTWRSSPTLISVNDGAKRSRDQAELSALLWALEELARLDAIARVLQDDDKLPGAVQKVIAIGSILDARHEPTDADLARTPALARLYQASAQAAPKGE